ncbi:hypothetical protein [Desulfopila sp. IMCC35008]|uniref:hypothetical protein n=1 Tax=Desulfopila sp. IMCC35008 TaxID=2653858 RepID=UPI0013D23633|nr:hypothetical protein [Desulfopila sp. IMCC35008]
MSGNNKPIRIAVNLMRARLTVIGFNIAIVSFQIAQLPRITGGVNIPGIEHPLHLTAGVELYMALALSLIAIIAFIMSSEFDEVGTCTQWTLIAGDLLMYLALAYTIAGFFAPLGGSIRNVAANLPGHPEQTLILQKSVLIAGGIAWFLAMYIGPLISLIRSPFPQITNLSLGIGYISLVLLLSWVNSQAVLIEISSGSFLFEPGMVLRELTQPLRW